MDFGKRHGDALGSERIAILDDILDTVPAGGRLLVEIKAGLEAVELIRKAIAGSRAQSKQIVLIAFKRTVLIAAAQAMPKCEASWIVDLRRKQSKPTSTTADRLADQVRRSGLNSIDLGVDLTCDLSIVPALHKHDLLVYCWTVNDLTLARHLVTAGIDGITSDRAAWLMKQVVQQPG